MHTFYGIVEDRQDPLKIGRVRVRIHGLHSEIKTQIATPDLPWSTVILPTTSAGLSGFGTQHGLVEGSSVYGFFRDGASQQDPVVTGVVAGISVQGYKKDLKGKLIRRKVDEGFSDPRRLTTGEYKDTPDGTTPQHNPKRTYGLSTALDTAPQAPDGVEIDYKGKGSTITEPTKTQEKGKPYYPIYTDVSDLSSLARGEGDYTSRDTSSANGIPSTAKTVYPYNKVLQTESVHALEIDDTLGVERIAVEHRSGTFHEIHPDGSQVTRVVNDNYTIVCKDNELYVGGKVNIKILGDAKLDIGGNADIDVQGTTDIVSVGDLSLVAPNIKLNS